ncbi:MAG TPA: lysophospholipase [Candidatus Caccomorpha excrementavium]|nr:lysophospholipase [Candidatus Caccomorpha excrementavium]
MTTILFQGDSLTDACRDKSAECKDPNRLLGVGYVNHLAQVLMSENPDIRVLNHGVNGNRIMDLYARWIEDTLNIDFQVLSILIGVNDVGFALRMNKGADAEKFAFIYDRMLYEVKRAKPEAALVLCEPFLCRLKPEEVEYGTDIIEGWEIWNGQIKERAAIVRDLAGKYGAVLVPSGELFEKACMSAPASHWSVDGIHLTPAGNGLLAKEWLRCVKGAGNVPV